MKLNPFYIFLKDYQDSSNIIVKEHLAVILASREWLLDNPVSIYIEGKPYPVTGLHITVLREYEEGTTNQSLYHMTIECRPYSIYRYEDKYGNKSEFYVREKSDEYKTTSMPLDESEHPRVEHLISSILEPLLFAQLNNHKAAIATLRKDFNQGYQAYMATSFSDITPDKEMLIELVTKGEHLKRISFNQEARASTSFLSAALKLTTDNSLLISGVADNTEAESKTVIDDERESQIVVLKAIPAADDSISETKSTLLISQAQEKIARIKVLLEKESNLKIYQLEDKIKLINAVYAIIRALFVDSIELDEFKDETFLDVNQIYLINIEIEAALSAIVEKGTWLLTIILTSADNLAKYGDCLTPFVPYIELERMERMLKYDQDWALTYMLNYSQTPVNSYRLDIEVLKGASLQKLSLLATAYHYNAIKCMDVLIKKNAHVHTLYKEKPLSHLIQQLSLSDPLRQLFFNSLPDWPKSNLKFYREMEKSLELCIATTDSSAQESASLLDAVMLYRSYQTDPTLADRKTYEFTQEILGSIDCNNFDSFRQTASYRNLMEIHNAAQDSISKHLKNNPQLTRLIKLETREWMGKISADAKNSTFLKEIFENMGESDFCRAIESKNQYLLDINALLSHLALPIPKNKKDKKAYHKLADELYSKISAFEAMHHTSYDLNKTAHSMFTYVQDMISKDERLGQNLPPEYLSLLSGSMFDKDPMKMLNAGLDLLKRGVEGLRKRELTEPDTTVQDARVEVLDDSCPANLSSSK